MGFPASSVVLVAETGGALADFGPYVAAINDSGVIAFRAQKTGGGDGVFLGQGGSLRDVYFPLGELIGHPDLDSAGRVGLLTSELEAGPIFWLCEPERGMALHVTARDFAAAGPRGPMMNQAGVAVFCARLSSGEECVLRAEGNQLCLTAITDERFSSFPGLPVVNQAGDVAFAAVLAAGGTAILLRRGPGITIVASTEGEFEELGAFPALRDTGEVGFTGRTKSGTQGAFAWQRGDLRRLSEDGGPFENVRSVLLHGEQGLLLCATPRGGQLGLYRGADQRAQRILGLGDPWSGSTIANFALNAVSLNTRGQAAVRLQLADGRQLILRAEIAAS